MNVRVKLLGPLRRPGERPIDGVLDFTLADGATTRDLLSRLAARFGEPFSDAAQEGAGLPGVVRVFVDGQLVVERDRRLAPPGAPSQKVIVDVMVPIMGGR